MNIKAKRKLLEKIEYLRSNYDQVSQLAGDPMEHCEYANPHTFPNFDMSSRITHVEDIVIYGGLKKGDVFLEAGCNHGIHSH